MYAKYWPHTLLLYTWCYAVACAPSFARYHHNNTIIIITVKWKINIFCNHESGISMMVPVLNGDCNTTHKYVTGIHRKCGFFVQTVTIKLSAYFLKVLTVTLNVYYLLGRHCILLSLKLILRIYGNFRCAHSFLDKPNQKHIISNFGSIRCTKRISFLYSFNCLS